MKVKSKTTYKIPEPFITYIFYDDPGDLSEEDISAIENFKFHYNLYDSLGSWSIGEQPYFSHYNDVIKLGSNVYDCIFTRWEWEDIKWKIIPINN